MTNARQLVDVLTESPQRERDRLARERRLQKVNSATRNFSGHLRNAPVRIKSGLQVSPDAEQAMVQHLTPLVAKLMVAKTGHTRPITSNIYGPEYATELARKIIRMGIRAVAGD